MNKFQSRKLLEYPNWKYNGQTVQGKGAMNDNNIKK